MIRRYLPPRLARLRRAERGLAAEVRQRQREIDAIAAAPPALTAREADERDDRRRLRLAEIALIERGPANRWERDDLRPIVVAAGIVAPAGSLDPCDDLGGLHAVRRAIRQIEDELRADGTDVDALVEAPAAPPPTEAPVAAKAAAMR